MKLYVEVNIEEGPQSVSRALIALSEGIIAREAEYGDSLERKAITNGAYTDVHPDVIDVQVY